MPVGKEAGELLGSVDGFSRGVFSKIPPEVSGEDWSVGGPFGHPGVFDESYSQRG